MVALLPAAVGGALLAVVLAYALSPLMPVGIAREADPDLGLSFDPLVLGVGFVAVALAVIGPRGLQPRGGPSRFARADRGAPTA